ncbi:MAG: BBP7 family outer membrane beta-barrel protein [Gemmataceae bacterium]|nr:BBP7 family outer membrane beta-barrel protein [Gemmataceae bacterium]
MAAMKALAIGSLGVLLGFAAADALGQHVSGAGEAGLPAFQRTKTTSDTGVILNRPRPLSQAATGAVVPAMFSEPAAPIFRAKVTDPDEIHRLMPLGPTAPVVVQPGTAKPLQPPEPLPVPRPVEPHLGPVPHGQPLPTILNDCGSCPGPAPSVAGCVVLGDCGLCEASCSAHRCGVRHGWLRECAGCCDDDCCLPRPGKFWLRGEYLLWQLNRQSAPPLVSSDPTGLGEASGRALPGTQVIYGDEQLQDDNGIRSGARFAFGFWFPHCCDWGLDASFFFLANRGSQFTAGSPGVISRLFYDDTNQQEAYQVVSGPYTDPFGQDFVANGTTTIQNKTRLWGFDVNFRKKLCCGPRYWLDGQIGYRYLQLADTLDIYESIYPDELGRPFQQTLVYDGFRTRNQFNGFQLGLEGELRIIGRWYLAGSVKVAFGVVRQVVDIQGSTTFLNVDDGTGQNIPRIDGVGGLYALVTNIGRYERDDFAFLPEFGIKLGFDITDHLRIYAGYNALYLSSVVRAADQIDRRVNIDYIPDVLNPRPVRGPQPMTPAVLLRRADFWAQGAQFGLEYHW